MDSFLSCCNVDWIGIHSCSVMLQPVELTTRTSCVCACVFVIGVDSCQIKVEQA